MQKLNGREYFVIVLVGIISIVLFYLAMSETFSSTSPFVRTGDGSTMSVDRSAIINLAATFLNLIVSIIGFSFMLMKRRIGWIASFCILLFYVFVAGYMLVFAFLMGMIEGTFWFGVMVVLMLLMAIVFLLIPSTVRKFKVTRLAIVPILFILGLIVTFYYIIPR